MADIFISYRRAEHSYANWLVSELEKQFAIFYDVDTIDYGDHFPDRIAEALDNCEVFLAVIGPGWLGEKHPIGLPPGRTSGTFGKIKNFFSALGSGRRGEMHPNRLHDSRDWVRHEIETVLGRKRVRIVPVLVGDAQMPSEKDLPETLHPFLRHNAISLSHKSRRSDLDVLTTSLNSWLSGSAYSASARNPVPHVLPHLCDRTRQEDHLVDLFTENQSKTPVIIMHGHKWEEHHGFVTRLRHQQILEDVLDVRDDDIGIDLKALNWSVESPKTADYEKLLFTAIKRDVIQKRTISDQEARDHFQSIMRPLVLVIEITWSDCKRCGDRLIEGFLSAWRSLFQEPQADATTRRKEPPFAVLLWINISYDDLNQKLSFDNILQDSSQYTFKVLPLLNPLEGRHIRTWISMDEVDRHVAGRRGQLLSIVEDENRCFDKGKIHMRCFVEAVQEILT